MLEGGGVVAVVLVQGRQLEERILVLWVQFGGPSEVRRSLCQPVLPRPGPAEPGLDIRGLGVKFSGGLIVWLSLGGLAGSEQSLGEQEVRLEYLGLGGGGGFEVWNGLARLLLPQKNHPQIHLGFVQVRLQLENGPVAGDCFRVLAQKAVDQREVKAHHVILGIGCDGLGELLGCGGVVFLAQGLETLGRIIGGLREEEQHG